MEGMGVCKCRGAQWLEPSPQPAALPPLQGPATLCGTQTLEAVVSYVHKTSAPLLTSAFGTASQLMNALQETAFSVPQRQFFLQQAEAGVPFHTDLRK